MASDTSISSNTDCDSRDFRFDGEFPASTLDGDSLTLRLDVVLVPDLDGDLLATLDGDSLAPRLDVAFVLHLDGDPLAPCSDEVPLVPGLDGDAFAPC